MPGPVFILAFANNAADPEHGLPALDKEFARLDAVLGDAAQKRWELVPSPQTSISSFLDLLQAHEYQKRIALLHFAGHANGSSLLMESADGAPEIASASGIAEFLALHPGLGFIFLNACSTVGQVQALLDAGVPAVIATEHDVNDKVATEFSIRFYKELVNGVTLRKAFDIAASAVKTDLSLRTASETRSIKGVGQRRDPDDWPWKLHVREGSRNADQWSLGTALGDPLWGLREPAKQDLPASPFRHLLPFGAQHARIFFGRRRETRALYDAIVRGDAKRVVLLHGVSGAGKSSLLEAGLLPRLIEYRAVTYRRRDPAHSLLDNLRVALGLAAGGDVALIDDLAAAWKALETPERPLTVILDQLEEALTDPARKGRDELAVLASALKRIFDQRDTPAGSIVLGFRKEWIAEVQAQLHNVSLASTDIFLDRLDDRGIIEVVNGVSNDAALRAHFHLSIPDEDSGLGQEIADDLNVDTTSAIAPTLQVLLTRLWERGGTGTGDRVFTRAMYQEMRKDGTLLDDFVDQQLAHIRAQMPEAADSGLVLDVLDFHVSVLGDATRSVTRTDRLNRYPATRHLEVDRILRLAGEARLVSIGPEVGVPSEAVGVTRLGHDTLAAYVRLLTSHSERPVQRAQRALEERAEEWSSTEVVSVEERRATRLARIAAIPGRLMRWCWAKVTAPFRFVRHLLRDVRDIIVARRLRLKRLREGRTLDRAALQLVELGVPWMRELRVEEHAMLRASRGAHARGHLARSAAGVALVALAITTCQSSSRVQARGILAAASNTSEDPLRRFLLMRELDSTTLLLGGLDVAATIATMPIPTAYLDGHTNLVLGAAFSQDSNRVVTWSIDSTARVWNANGVGVATTLPHRAPLTGAAISPDGRCVVTTDTVPSIHLWDVLSEREVLTYRDIRALRSARFSPDGRSFATANAVGDIRVWSNTAAGCGTATTWGKPIELAVGTIASPRGAQLYFLPNGDLFTLGDSAHGAAIHRKNGPTVPVQAPGLALAGGTVSLDGRHLVLWGAHEVRVFDLDADGKTRRRAAVSLAPKALGSWQVAIDAHGRRLAIHPGAGDSVLVMSMRALKAADAVDAGDDTLATLMPDSVVLRGHRGNIAGVEFSPDGRRLLTYADDGTARVWSFDLDPRGRVPMELHASGNVLMAAFNRAGDRIVTVQGSSARIWAAQASDEPAILRTGAHDNARATMSADGRIFALGEGRVLVWDSALVLRASIPVPATSSVTFAVDAPGHRIAMTWGDSVQIVRLGADAGPMWRAALHDTLDYPRPIAFSPDGEWLGVGHSLGVALYHPDTLGASTEPHMSRARKINYRVTSLAFIPPHGVARKLLLMGDAAGRRFRWAYEKGDSLAILKSFYGAVNSIAINDSPRLFGYALNTGLAEVGNGLEVQTRPFVHAERGAMTAVAFNHAGDRVVTASRDGTAEVWSWPEGSRLMTLRGHSGPVTSAEFTPDGNRVVTASTDGTVRVWEVSWNGLMRRIANRQNSVCLTMEERHQLLAENYVSALLWWASCDGNFGR